MTFQTWVDLFGRTAEDPDVKAELRKNGIKNKLVMPKDFVDLFEDIGSMTLHFQDESLFRNLPPVGEGNCVLCGCTVFLDYPGVEPYPGALPFDIERSATRDELRKRFGEPTKISPFDEWDEWSVDDRHNLTATYLSDKSRLESLKISLKSP